MVLERLLGNANWQAYTGRLHAGIDLTRERPVISLVDDTDYKVQEVLRPHDAQPGIADALRAYRGILTGIVVLAARGDDYQVVDDLLALGFAAHCVTPSEVRQFAGLKNTGEWHDAYWLAHLLRLGVLPDGSVYGSLRINEASGLSGRGMSLHPPMAGELPVTTSRVAHREQPVKRRQIGVNKRSGFRS